MFVQERGLIHVVTMLNLGWSLLSPVLISFIHFLVLCLIGIPKAIVLLKGEHPF